MLQTMKINVDGTVESAKPKNDGLFELEELQSAVQGMIEVVYLNSHNALMIVNEEGKLLDLPLNKAATLLMRHEYPDSTDFIVGDVLIIQRTEIE